MAQVLKLRPHHLIDIVTELGDGREFEPHPYGHAVHIVAHRVVEDPHVEIEFVLAADDICAPCRHLQPDSTCDDILQQLSPPQSKQAYNDKLDRLVFDRLRMSPGDQMSLQEFLMLLRSSSADIARVCVHPGEKVVDRLEGLLRGLDFLQLA
jgi:hypothetical protein